MKTIKPLKLGVLHRTFDDGQGRQVFVPTVVLFFPFSSPSVPLQDVELWKIIAEELGGESAFDEAMYKARGEVLVTGNAYPRGGEPQPAVEVRVQLGSVDKRLYVVGDRVWKKSGVASDPEPFTEMPVRWSHAFGGEGYDQNPKGIGHRPVVDDDGEKVHRLPNVEDPKQLLRSPGQRPAPAGLGAYAITWPQRFAKTGTYDDRWFKERYPGLAEDLDWTFFNVAPPDQWIEGYFEGDETFVVENMHPSQPTIESRLPGLKCRCFLTRRDQPDDLDEVPLRIDTVHLIPHRGCGVVLFRGVTEVQEDDAADLLHLMVACEDPREPKPLDHYRRALATRLDKRKGALAAIRDGDLMPRRDPEAPPVELETIGDFEAIMKTDNLVAQKMRIKAQRQLDEARQMLLDKGVDPDAYGIPAELPPAEQVPDDPDELPAMIDELDGRSKDAQAEGKAKQEAALAEMRAHLAERGVDLDAILEERKQQQGGPPEFSADAQYELLHQRRELSRNAGMDTSALDAKLNDPELFLRLKQAEEQLVEAYRRWGYHFPEAARLQGEAADNLRATVEEALAKGESLARRDLTGADLHGLDFSGCDLRGVYLECANLAGCTFARANLERAVLTRADLSDASFTEATVTELSLGGAKLHRTDLSGLDLTGVVLGLADVEGATFAGSTLDRADLIGVRMGPDCDFSRVKAEGLTVMALDGESEVALRGLDLSGCVLRDCVFVYVDVSDASFAGATLESAAFVGSRGERANFDGVDGKSLRFVHGCHLAGATFRGAILEQANFRGADLTGADFEGAQMPHADLSECDLAGASLYRVQARRAQLVKSNLSGARLVSADLMESILQKANIEGADFKGANLFRVDFALIQGNDATDFTDANMKYIRFVERHDAGLTGGA